MLFKKEIPIVVKNCIIETKLINVNIKRKKTPWKLPFSIFVSKRHFLKNHTFENNMNNFEILVCCVSFLNWSSGYAVRIIIDQELLFWLGSTPGTVILDFCISIAWKCIISIILKKFNVRIKLSKRLSMYYFSCVLHF